MDNLCKNTIYVLLATVGYSLMTIFFKLAMNRGIDGLLFMGMASVVAAVFYWIQVFIRRENAREITLPLVVCMVCNIMIFYFQTSAMRLISVSIFNIIYFTYPVFVAVLGRIIFKHHIGNKKAICLGIAVLGLVLAIGAFESSASFNVLGIILTLGCSVANAGYFLSQPKMFERVSYNVALSYIFTGLSVFMLLFYMANGGSMVMPSMGNMGLVLTFSVVSVIIPSILMAVGINKIGAAKASMLNLVQPIITLVLARVLFSDTMSALQIVGCTVVILSIGLSAFEKKTNQIENVAA